MRAAYRNSNHPGNRNDNLGFRPLSSRGRETIFLNRRVSGPPATAAKSKWPPVCYKDRQKPMRTLAGRPLLFSCEWVMARNWKSHPLEDGCPPRWATAWGQDRYGVFVEFEVGEAMQRLRWIMPGKFPMGSPPDEEGRFNSEGPQHLVIISRGFWLFETPCCQDLWEAVMGKDKNPSYFRGPRRPVENVDWDECVSFINKLNDMIPELWLRLPREAEWEYACRAGTTATRYGELDAVAWHSGNSKETQDVGKKQINPWGLFDTLGNVWEWCRDDLRTYTSDVVRDPDGGRGAERVVRGGSWADSARDVRAACRDSYRPGGRSGDLGFRPLSSGIREEEEEPVREAAGAAERAQKIRVLRLSLATKPSRKLARR